MTMQVDLAGGFGEKGRTSVVVNHEGKHVMLDAGIKVGASGAEYYPVLNVAADEIDALLISHAHEDHVGALNWLLSKGFRGRILMTAETRDEAPATLESYADPDLLRRFPFPQGRAEIFEPGAVLEVGGLTVRTGRSGHVVGGVWFAVDDGESRLVYSADVVPDSNVFVMDPIPQCDILILDASYGADPVPGPARAKAIADWISTQKNGCLLPTPLSGRSLELIAAIPGTFAIHADMRASLEAQISAGAALLPGVAQMLRQRLCAAIDWTDTEPLPPCPLLVDDGMGRAGPSSRLLPLADRTGVPILLSGHLPSGTPGQTLHAAGRAEWIRMPTHPTVSGNVDIWEKAGCPMALGHSCEARDLVELGTHISALNDGYRTGDSLAVSQGKPVCVS